MWRTLLLFYFRTCRGGRSPAGCTNTFGTERKWHRGKLRSAPCFSTFSMSWHKPWEREGLCFCCCVSQDRKGGELCGVTGRKNLAVQQLFISEERRSNLFCLTPQNVLILPPSPWSIRWTVHASASVLSSSSPRACTRSSLQAALISVYSSRNRERFRCQLTPETPGSRPGGIWSR